MSRPESIVDYYGTELEAEGVMASPGPMVDLTWQESVPDLEEGFFRLTPENAIELGKQLIAAGEGRS